MGRSPIVTLDFCRKTYSGVEISQKCGVVLYGNTAVACGDDTVRALASTLQLSLTKH